MSGSVGGFRWERVLLVWFEGELVEVPPATGSRGASRGGSGHRFLDSLPLGFRASAPLRGFRVAHLAARGAS